MQMALPSAVDSSEGPGPTSSEISSCPSSLSCSALKIIYVLIPQGIWQDRPTRSS